MTDAEAASERGPGERERAAAGVAVGGPGVEEATAAWPVLARRRLEERLKDSSRYPQLVLVAALYGLFSVGFTITLLTVSIATMADELDTSTATLAWVITGPLLVFGVLGPIVGKLGDVYGQRRVFLVGLTVAGVSSLAVAVAWDAASLIAFRIVGAAAGAACGPASMAILNTVFPPERRVQAMGYWSMVNAGGPVLGVIAGGPVVEALSWRVVFLVQAPLVLFGVALAALLLPQTARQADVRIDVVGAVLLGASATSLLFALNRAPVWGWAHAVVVGGFALAPAAAAAFVAWERRVAHPLLRLEYLRRRNVAAPVAAQACTSFAYMGGFVVTPLFLADVFGYGETRIGLVSVARPLAFGVVAPLAGYVAVRAGARVTAMAGAAAVAASMLLMTGVRPSSTDVVLVAALALGGVGQGGVLPAMVATVANAVDDADLGVAGAVQQLASTVAAVAGVQLMQTVQLAVADSASLLASYHRAYLLGAAVALLGVVAAAFVRPARAATR